VVIVVALLVAYYITQPNSPLWVWQASTEAKASATKGTVSTGTGHVKWWKRIFSSYWWYSKFLKSAIMDGGIMDGGIMEQEDIEREDIGTIMKKMERWHRNHVIPDWNYGEEQV
jgi:hypothetical protein